MCGMYVCICILKHTFVCLPLSQTAQERFYIHECIHTYTFTFTHAYACIHEQARIFSYRKQVALLVNIHTHTDTGTYTSVFECV